MHDQEQLEKIRVTNYPASAKRVCKTTTTTTGGLLLNTAGKLFLKIL
jgi:hypothetical protein